MQNGSKNVLGEAIEKMDQLRHAMEELEKTSVRLLASAQKKALEKNGSKTV